MTVGRSGTVTRSPVTTVRCCTCGRLRPDPRWAFGLDAVDSAELVAWLCDECEVLDGKGWAFLDAIRQLYPSAEILTTTVYADVIMRATLVAPSYVPPAAPEGPSS